MGETGTGDASTERPGHGLAGRVRAALLGLALAATCVPLGACLGFGDAPASARTQDPFEHEAPSHRAVEPSLDEARRSELGSAASRPDEARASADELARAEEADGHERAASIEAAHVRDEPRALPPTGAGNASEREEPTTIAGEGGDAGELDAEAGDAPTTGDLRLERGPGLLSLLIPRGEELAFEVEIDLGALGEPTVGKVTLSSGAEPYIEGLPTRGGATKKSGKEAGWIKSTARGNHLGYELDHQLYVRHLPRPMPRVLLTDTQKGSENRQRRLKLGSQDDKLVAIYEHDGHCKVKGCDQREHFVESKWIWGKPYHCEKCKKMEHRIWKEPMSREIPPGTLDMLSAVYLARTMVREGLDAVTFPLVDKQKLWEVDLKRGKRTKTIEVPAGRFSCTQVQLLTRVPAGEPSDGEGFQGLFGIQGTIQIWVETTTGVPVLISGTLPVPVLGDLDVRVELAKFKGTPAGFGPIK